jgi:hypothetical protein
VLYARKNFDNEIKITVSASEQQRGAVTAIGSSFLHIELKQLASNRAERTERSAPSAATSPQRALTGKKLQI